MSALHRKVAKLERVLLQMFALASDFKTSESISTSDSTRMTRITRMHTDTIIRVNPSDLCHPCSWSILLYSQRFQIAKALFFR